MRVSLSGKEHPEELLSSIRTVVSSVEPGVMVSEERSANAPSSLPKGDMIRLAAGAMLWLAALFLPLGETARLLLYVTAYLTAGIEVIRTVAGTSAGGLFSMSSFS
jgi:hypothetical protein